VSAALGKLDEAIAEYRKAIQLDPHLTLAHYGLGNVFRRCVLTIGALGFSAGVRHPCFTR
jgi:tetratricopeptide (TPR) repeat protein